jgi:hypothetical protein
MDGEKGLSRTMVVKRDTVDIWIVGYLQGGLAIDAYLN